MLKVLYHHAKFGLAGISPADGAVKTLSFLFVCLVCLSVALLNDGSFCVRFRREKVGVQNDFDTVG